MKPQTKNEAKHLKDLYAAMVSLATVDEARRFLVDLCTPAELTAMADRWRVAKLLQRDVPYRKIYEQTGVSTATVTRVARTLSHGEGGYQIVLSRSGAQKVEEGE